MKRTISERYRKCLVTVAMGFRTEEDIKKNGLYIFDATEKEALIDLINSLFEHNKSVLTLGVKKSGYRTKHMNIDSDEAKENFIANVSTIFDEYIEVWVVASSVKECWRCRILLSSSHDDIIELAYSYDDHILDHLNCECATPYVCYKSERNQFGVSVSKLNDAQLEETNFIVHDIYSRYSSIFEGIRTDLQIMKIDNISLDVRIDDGYYFHDFDVAYGDTQKVVDYYVQNDL